MKIKNINKTLASKTKNIKVKFINSIHNLSNEITWTEKTSLINQRKQLKDDIKKCKDSILELN